MRRRRHIPRRDGAAILELALLLPLMLALLLGIWEVGRMVEVQQVVSNAAREGARQAASGARTAAQVRKSVLNYLSNGGLSTSGTTVTVTNVPSPGTDPTNATQLQRLNVSVAVPFASVRWIALDLFVSPGSNITSSADWFSLRDLPLDVTANMPIE
jgi:Flp pilus assembly protein TadG